LLLLGSAVTAWDTDLPARWVTWLRERIGRRPGNHADEEEAGADDGVLPVGMPHLVPVPIVEGGEAVPPRTPRSIHEDRERILPRT
jgi:hypothetical protein